MSNRAFDMFRESPWRLLRVADLGEASLVPTMLTLDEQKYYLWLTREWAQGAGAIVDLGAFAGGSTACLAEGQKQAGRTQPVHGYDKFVVNDFDVFRGRYETYLSGPPASESGLDAPPLPPCDGDDLRPVVEALLSPWRDTVRLHKGQIEDMAWTGGPIEILVLDASKAAATTDRMSETFFPHLVPGRSVIVQQDFLWWQQPWIAAQMAMLAEHFQPVAFVPNFSVSFLCTRPVDADAMRQARTAQLSDAQMLARIRRVAAWMDGFGLRRKHRRLLKAVKANPGRRKAFQFKTSPD